MVKILFGFCRLHLRKLALKRLGMASKKTVSTLRKFKNVTKHRLQDLTKTKLKKRTEAKMLWAVRAYIEWRKV